MCNCGKRRAVPEGGDRGRGVPVATASPAPVMVAPRVRRTMLLPVAAAAPVRPPPVVRPVVRQITTRPVARQVPAHRQTVTVSVPAAPSIRARERLAVISPTIWGPPLWRLLHALAEKRETDTEWPTLLRALREGIPCPECAYHYNAWYARNPLRGRGVAAWLLALHNDVNRRNKKAEWNREAATASVEGLTRDECVSLLEQLRGKVGRVVCDMLAGMIGRL
jgi:hypothetical protein